MDSTQIVSLMEGKNSASIWQPAHTLPDGEPTFCLPNSLDNLSNQAIGTPGTGDHALLPFTFRLDYSRESTPRMAKWYYNERIKYITVEAAASFESNAED